MKADKREIVTFVIAALATLVAVWFFLSKMQKEKETVRTDLYTLVAPASDAILSVNRPAAFTKYILSRNSERDAFASKVPDIYLSIIQNNRDLPWLLLSFHSRQLLPHIENTFCSTNIPCILFPLSSPHSKFFSHFLNQIHFLDHLYIIHLIPHLLFHMGKIFHPL